MNNQVIDYTTGYGYFLLSTGSVIPIPLNATLSSLSTLPTSSAVSGQNLLCAAVDEARGYIFVGTESGIGYQLEVGTFTQLSSFLSTMV